MIEINKKEIENEMLNQENGDNPFILGGLYTGGYIEHQFYEGKYGDMDMGGKNGELNICLKTLRAVRDDMFWLCKERWGEKTVEFEELLIKDGNGYIHWNNLPIDARISKTIYKCVFLK